MNNYLLIFGFVCFVLFCITAPHYRGKRGGVYVANPDNLKEWYKDEPWVYYVFEFSSWGTLFFYLFMFYLMSIGEM